jgi:uncharacterized protein
MSRIVPVMRLNEHIGTTLNLIRAWSPDSVTLGTERLERAFLVAPQTLLTDWPVQRPEQLDDTVLAPLWALAPQVVLLGAGTRTQWPPASLRSLFARRNVALEAMDLGAACRTYNVLAQESRAVASLLFPGHIGT